MTNTTEMNATATAPLTVTFTIDYPPRFFRVYFLRQVVNPLRHDNFTAKWDLKRETALELVVELPLGKHPEWLAEKMFHLTNAPVECLSEEDQELLEQTKPYNGPSLSVGDVVRVEYGLIMEEFLCLPCGWEQK